MRDVNPSMGSCGSPTLEVLSTAGHRRTVHRYVCGEDGHWPGGATWVRGRLTWLMYGFTPAFSQWNETTGKIATHHFRKPVVAYAPLTPSTAITLVDNHPTPGVGNDLLDLVSEIHPVVGG